MEGDRILDPEKEKSRGLNDHHDFVKAPVTLSMVGPGNKLKYYTVEQLLEVQIAKEIRTTAAKDHFQIQESETRAAKKFYAFLISFLQTKPSSIDKLHLLCAADDVSALWLW